MPSELVKFCNPKSAQKALWTRLLYAEFHRYFVKKLKKAQTSSKSHEMTFLQPKQTMNSLLGVKIAQNPYFWFGYIAKNEERSRTQPVFQSQKKSPWEFLYLAKNLSPKTHLRSEKTWERWKQFLQAVFCWKIVHIGRCLAIRSTNL